MTINCPTCRSLERSVEAAQAENNTEKERIMRLLLDQHRVKHKQPVVVWKNGTYWTLKQEA